MAAVRHVEMLAVKGEVLAFQCKSFSSKTRDHRKGSEVSFYSLSFARDSQSFSIRDRNLSLIHKDGSAEADVVHCCSALDIQQRQKVPCVLLRLCKKRTSAFKYMLYSICTSTDAKLHAEFVLPYEMRDNISILLGPALIWSHENSVFYTSSQTSGVKEVPIPMTVNFIGELPLRRRKLVIQGAQNVPSDQSKVKNILYFIEDGRTLSSACLVPDAYSSVIQCMMVLSAEEFDGGWRSAVLAATSMKQLVRFENGLPLDVCLLPYEQPLSIQVIHTLKNDGLVVVTFSQGNVCAVWKDTFQVAGCWTGVRLLLVDDFMGCGTDQMLLVFESSSAEPLSSFLLTDLCAVTYSCCRSDGEELNSSDAAQENHLLTVQALESRLQSGLSGLEDLQRDVEVKDRLLQQSLVALTDLVSGREHAISSPEQEGLVSLWDEDDDDDGAGDEEDAGMQTECAEAPLKMHRVWQRVIGQSLIVGVVLTTTSNTPGRTTRSAPWLSDILHEHCSKLRAAERVWHEARDDLLSLLALLDVWFFRLECPCHTLADVQGWLQESLRFERLEIDPRFTADPSSVRLFRWEQNSPFQGILSVYCRDELSLLHFLHSLCDFLPVSHDVQPLERPSVCAGSLAQTLQTEIHTVTQEASSVLRTDEGARRGEAESQTLHNLREEWLKERGRCNERLRPLLDETRYSRLIERMIHAQLDADEAALMEAPRL
ncbi:Fanconi anemia group B protein [Sinocyclocheilus grahami]|uniref:Fanconi anemia group B protein n=1 Tax=Sinocyclocheilus grahami TaxID=75366 RepID=UPI0007AD1BFB|nr:PREDICTED: Fanconi anemia group B protein [Sinocyclocheilus grahami]